MLTFFGLSNYAQWQQTNGPYGGNINCIATNGIDVYAGTCCGFYKSSDNGLNWTAINTSWSNQGLVDIEMDGTIIYAGLGNGNVYLSTDNGVNWTLTNPGMSFTILNALDLIDHTLYAATYNGLYVTTDSASSWTAMNLGVNCQVYSTAVSGSNIFAGIEHGVLLSTDNGATWTHVNNGFAIDSTGLPEPVRALAVYGTTVIAGNGTGIYLSTDYGASWNWISTGPWNCYMFSISGTNLYAVDLYGVYLSTDGGLTWNNIGLSWVKSIALSGSNIFAGANNGVFLSNNNGVNWINLTSGMIGSNISELETMGSNIFAGYYQNNIGSNEGGMFLSNDNGSVWNSPGLNYDIKAFAVSGNNVFAGCNNGVLVSTDSGASWTLFNNGMTNHSIYSLAVSGSNIFAGSYFQYNNIGGIYMSSDNGASWNLVKPDSALSGVVSSIVVSGSNIFAAYNYYNNASSMFLSTDNGATWNAINSGLPGSYIYSLAASGSNIFLGIGGTVYRSTNNGSSWVEVNNGIPFGGVNTLFNYGAFTFAGNGAGVFLTATNGACWNDVSTGLINKAVFSLSANSQYLFAGIAGSGVWKRPLSDFTVNYCTNIFKGNVYRDANNNGIKDIGEHGIPGKLVKTLADNWYFSTDSAGNYIAYSNAYHDSIMFVNNYPYRIATPLKYSVTSQDTGKNFAVYTLPNISDLRITITPVTAARPGHNDVVQITYNNVGTDTLSGYVNLDFDNNYLSYLSSTPAQSSVNGGTVNWNFSNLVPLEQRNITANFNISSATANGTLLTFYSTVFPIIGDTTPANNHSGFDQVVTNSYDPNEKVVSPPGGFTPQQLSSGEYLEYTIHFQNTGTDTAFNIVVIDTLSPNLDISTFELLASSRPCTLHMRDAGIVEFDFNNILLPDSNVNVIGSNGFVKYAIKPKADLLLGDSINNTAYIYFDFNQPVETNTTSTEITLTTSIPKPLTSENDVYLFPNPATENLAIIASFQNSEIEITDMEGRCVKFIKAIKNKTIIDISNLAKGMYLMKVKTDAGIKTKKFIKE